MSSGPDNPAPAAPGSAGSAQPGPDSPQPQSQAAGGAQGVVPGPGDGQSERGASSYSDVKGRVGGKELEQQQEYLNRARTDFQGNQINAVYVNGNYGLLFGQGDTRIKARKVTPEELTEPFIRTAAIERLAGSIGDQPIIVLQGPQGYGKGAALVRTLSERSTGNAPLFFLDPSTDLATFTCENLPERAVLILQDLPESAADRFDDYAAKRIEGELRGKDCRLAITTGRGARLATRNSGILVIELDVRPDPRDVFRKHLGELLIGRVSRKDLLGWPGVAALVDAQLDADCSLADAQRLATLLSRATDNPETAAARVRAQMTEYADERVAQWFRRLPSLKVHCAAISLAVLNGLSREVIGHEAQVLEKIIMPAPDAPNAMPVANPFAADSAISPAMLEARVVTETQQRDEGLVVVQAMSYREPGYPGRVLRYVWREHDDGRAAIVEWLRYLGRSPDLKVRVRAATAVGVLACEAMEYLYNEIIDSWAHANKEEARDSAAIALGPPADDPQLRNTIRELVGQWAKPESSWQLRATAARAYGRTLGLTSPTSALRGLARLAEESDLDLDVMIAVGNSYCELVLEGTTPLSVRVIGEVERLAADRKRPRQATGRLTLLGLSTLRGAPPDLGEWDSRLGAWPTLLLLAAANPQLAESAARLWQLSLHDPDIGDMVTASLDDWAQDAETNAELRQALVSFLHWIAADPRSRHAILRRAHVWGARDGKAPKTGRSVVEGQR